MIIQLKRIISSLFLIVSFFASSQEIITISIPWESPKSVSIGEKTIKIPSIKDQGYSYNKPNFSWQKKIDYSINSHFQVLNFDTEAALQEEISYLNGQNINVSTQLEQSLKVTKGGGQVYAMLSLFPFIMQNGEVRRVVSITTELINVAEVHSSSQVKAVNSSVLAEGSGTWYKIAVRKDGIYKIDKNFLEEVGITTTNLNPQSINIFGNGDGKLPELNSVSRTDDLAKNAIFIEGESDGIFNEGDYILFYGWGPSRWYEDDAGGFFHDNNIYSDLSYYFININPNDSPLRISSINSADNSATHYVTSYSYFDTHEKDSVSLGKGGQRWYGELFDVFLERNIAFSIPNIESSSPVSFEISLVSNANSSPLNKDLYYINGLEIESYQLPSGNYGREKRKINYYNPSSSMALKMVVTRNSPTILTYLDKITINARRNLVVSSSQFNFRDLLSVGAGNVANFSLSNCTNTILCWDITDRHLPKKINGNLSNSTYAFQLATDTLREFVVSNGQNFFTPEKIGYVAYQNLHGLPQADYLIITPSIFIDQANRLANLHESEGLTVHVVTLDQVYNEFSSGMLDPTAIRSFGKMFYDRATLNNSLYPKYLLLFGDGTYDPRNRIESGNYVPTFQLVGSENMEYGGGYVSDDYYGLYDFDEGISPNDLLDIGVGRLLISDNNVAKNQVDKIEHYMKNGSKLFDSSQASCSTGESGTSTFGDWRLKTVVIADDENYGHFVENNAEVVSKYMENNVPEYNVDKIYCDAYTQITTAGGHRYPEVNELITDRINRGALIVNYVGHGGEVGAAEERIITNPQIENWKNINTLPLMITATCEFTKYDDPERISAGELVSLNRNGGAIVLMTTTRPANIAVNDVLLSNLFKNVFKRDDLNRGKAFGEIFMISKNSCMSDNNRVFTLIGDPALRITLPSLRVVTDSINGLDPDLLIDTIRALDRMTIKGHVEDPSSIVSSSFNGVITVTIFDKKKIQTTLGQDDASPVISFETQKNVLYKGKSSVVNGFFELTFIVPKDIDYSFGRGKISYYAENGIVDAAGLDTMFIVGGVNPDGIDDKEGPDISIFLNDSSFVNSSITDESPVLLAHLFDENGINTVGNGVGHDLVAVIDDNTADPIVLNDYYIADLNTYQSGSLKYTIPHLEKGHHTLSVKAWDVNNNSSETEVEFTVQEKEDIQLAHVLNYPNPFTTKTEFFFEHNQVCNSLDVQIQIFTVSGKLVKTINQNVHTEGFRTEGIPWDGLDEYGDQLAKGVYIYRLTAKMNRGKKDEQIAEQVEKLVILR